MNNHPFRVAIVSLVAIAFAAADRTCHAHFPWLTIDEDGHALLYFSESPAERDYKLPETVDAATVEAFGVDGKPIGLKFETVEEANFVGRKSSQAIDPNSVLTTSFVYGNYHGTLLSYYALHLPPVGSPAIELPDGKSLKLSAKVTPTKNGLQVAISWEGKPLPGASVTIVDAEGERFEEKSNEQGQASFSTGAEGLTGFIIGHTIKSAGQWKDQSYQSESHYCTLTTHYTPQQTEKTSASMPLAPLPEAIASFGAAVCDGWLYVYSGHTGKAHDHSRDNLSQDFRRLRLDGQSEWESLPMQTPLQGLPLIAHAGKLYRVGGLNATNAAGEDADMHSVDEFACFDPQTRQWTALPNLPEGRSSHDAVVLDGKLYVLGGWTLSGDSDGEWLDHGCVFDLAHHDSSWQPLADLPFRRRALAVGHWQGKIIALGGMDEDHDISRSVDSYDPSTKQWSKLADFPGEGMSGFGISAWNSGGKLYASGSEGIVYRLADDGQNWLKVAELARPRFFHRLVAGKATPLLVIAGAPLDEEGHLADIESVEP